MNCAGVVRVRITAKLEITSVRSKNSPQAGNFCKSQAGMKTTTTTIWLPWRCSTSTITFDHKSNYLPFTHVDSIRAIETKRVENDVSILIDKKINCLGAALVIWLHQLTNNFFFSLWCQSYLSKLILASTFHPMVIWARYIASLMNIKMTKVFMIFTAS